MTDRQVAIQSFLIAAGFGGYERHPLPGDASTRRYERLRGEGRTLMLMDQAPSEADIPCTPEMTAIERLSHGWFATARLSAGRLDAFVAVDDFLRAQGLSAPAILAVDVENGLLVCEDLGDDLFARVIERGEDEATLYLAAIEMLARLHETKPPQTLEGGWPLLAYDDLALKGGCDLFVEWYPQYDPSVQLTPQALAEWEAFCAPVRAQAQTDATVFIHRDFHAENLIWLPEREGVARVGLIDFQDALRGAPCWDLHSLLQDARRDVSLALEARCLDHYLSLRPQTDRTAFMRSYTQLATLNALRILGVFARLVVRDHKPRYEAFMPRMWGHVSRNLKTEGMEALAQWFNRYLAHKVAV